MGNKIKLLGVLIIGLTLILVIIILGIHCSKKEPTSFEKIEKDSNILSSTKHTRIISLKDRVKQIESNNERSDIEDLELYKLYKEMGIPQKGKNGLERYLSKHMEQGELWLELGLLCYTIDPNKSRNCLENVIRNLPEKSNKRTIAAGWLETMEKK